MKSGFGLESEHGASRRQILKGGLAAAAIAAMGREFVARAQNAPQRPAPTDGVKVIDIHAHYFPETFLNMVEDEGGKHGASYHMTDKGFFIKTPAGGNGPLSVKFIDLKARIADMDRQGVAVQAMSLTSPMLYWANADLSTKLARTWNDAAVAAHTVYPTRLVAFLTLPMLYPDSAIDELNRAAKLPGMRGVYMGSSIADRDLDDPLFRPILERIEAMGLPIFLHPVETVGGDRMKPYFLTNLVGNPVDTAIAAGHLIFGGVLDRYPKLRIGLPHAGGVLPILFGRMDQGWRTRPDLNRLSQMPSTYIPHFYYDTMAHSKPFMETIIKQVGAERVMIGSDYCFDMGYADPVKELEDLDLTGDQRKMILGENAAKALKL